MRILLLFCIFAYASSCTHFDPKSYELSESEKQQFLYDFASTNERIKAVYKSKNTDLNSMTLELYLNTLSELKSEKPVQTKKRLVEYDQKEVRADSNNLYICVYSFKYNFGACDSTKCVKTEIKAVYSRNDFESAFSTLKNYECNNNIGGSDAAK